MAEPLAARAVWFDAARSVEMRDEMVAPPAAGEVRVHTLVSALSHGTERLVYRGEVPPDLALDLPTLAGSYAFPIKYGYAAVGRVLDVGAGVATHRPGDLVFALQPHQTVFRVPAEAAVRLPPGLDPEQGVFVANLETALNIVHDTPLALGETAVVFGMGVVGLLVAQLLRRAGAGRVLAVEPDPLRRELALGVGVDAALAPGRDLAAQLAAVCGRAPDVAVEVSGAPAALQSAVESVAAEGAVVVASWYGTKPVQLMLGGHFHRGRLRLISSQVGRLSPALAARWDYARRTAAVLDLLPQLVTAELITHRIPFDVAADAYRLIDSPAGGAGQVVLTYAAGAASEGS